MSARRIAALLACLPLAGVALVMVAATPAAAGPCTSSAAAVAVAATRGQGFYVIGSDGCVGTAGDATNLGQPPAPLNAPAVGVAVNPVGAGYWEVAADGGVFAF